MTYNKVITFWFTEVTPDKWWTKNIEFDQLIRKKFTDIHSAAIKGELYKWRETAEGRLAEIIILDQFSRNMFRETPMAFSSDPLALILAQEAISVGADKKLTQVQRSFMYMPFMHSESLCIHDIAVELYRKNGVASNLDFEIKHRDIIVMFGRYPHRNIILGRSSTPDEIEFLQQPNSSF